MASTIITKNSSTASAVPVVGDLTKGELAVNVTDKKIYTKDNSAAVVKLVGSLGNQEANAVAITGGSIAGITDLAVADGGTGASTAAGALNNLLPTQTGNANKYLQTDGTNATWDAISISTGDITGTLPVANGGTGVTSSTGTGNVVLSNSPTLVTPALGTPASGVATNLTGLPLTTGVTGTLPVANGGTGVTTSTGTGNVVLSTSPTLVTPALGTPSALVGTNITGTASGLTAGNVTTNANLTGAVTSVGNATSLGSFTSAQLAGALTDETGTGSAVFATSPTLVTPILGTPTSATLTNATGLPIATGVSGLGTGVATFLATPSSANLRSALTDETGTGSAVFATSPTLVTPVLGTPTSATLTNATGLPLTTGVTGTLPTANGGTNLTSFTSGGVVYASSTSALATGPALTFDGTNLGVGLTATSPIEVGLGSAKYVTLRETSSNIDIGIQARSSIASGNSFLGGFATNSATGETRLSTGDYYTYFMTFYRGGSEGMRLTSTGLGIGTSSPTAKLQVNGATFSNNSTSSAFLTAGSQYYGSIANTSGANTYSLGYSTDGSTHSSVLYWNASGNVGIGTSSPATKLNIENAGACQLQMAYSSTIFGRVGRLSSGNYEFSSYENGGNLLFGTTTTNGSTTERMRLDSAGNLGLGVTPSAWGSNYKALQIGAQTILYNAVNYVTSLNTNAYEDSAGALLRIAAGDATRYTQAAGAHAWFTAGNGSAGSVASFTQAMTLTADGNLLVGATSGSYHTFNKSSSVALMEMNNSNASPVGLYITFNGASPNGTANEFLTCRDTTTNRAIIRSNGGIANYSANDVNLSDRREKTNFAPATSYLDKICAIPVQTFNYIDQNLEEDGGLTLGVVAQDVQAVAPELVMESNWASKDEEPKMRLSIYQTDLQYALMKCIQEQQVIIESLKARLDAANL